MRLEDEAVVEHARLVRGRVFLASNDRGPLVVPATGQAVAFARRRQLRSALGSHLIVVVESRLEDAAGRAVASHLTALRHWCIPSNASARRAGRGHRGTSGSVVQPRWSRWTPRTLPGASTARMTTTASGRYGFLASTPLRRRGARLYLQGFNRDCSTHGPSVRIRPETIGPWRWQTRSCGSSRRRNTPPSWLCGSLAWFSSSSPETDAAWIQRASNLGVVSRALPGELAHNRIIRAGPSSSLALSRTCFLARASLEPARAAGSRSRAVPSRAGVRGTHQCRAAERHPRGDAVGRVGAHRADRCTVGTTA